MTTDPLQNNDWQSGGWESGKETPRWMMGATFDDRFRWICETNERIVVLHGPSGLARAKGLTIIPNKKDVLG